MARIRLKLDIDLAAFESDLVAAILQRLPQADPRLVQEAVHAVVSEDMVVAEWCGTRLFCSEVEAFEPMGGCENK